MKINWFSNAPWAPTGYGNQTKVMYPRLIKLGHELSITAFYGLQGGIIDVGGVTIFPVVRHAYGMDVIGAHAAAWGADIIITLVDSWVIEPQNIPAKIGWYPWFPIDTEPVHDAIISKVKRARKGIVLTKFAQREMAKQGIDTYYVPHGIECNVFKLATNRDAAKELAHLPKDRYIVGMIAANKGTQPIRKAFVEQVAAFAEFKKTHNDALLYIHTEDGGRGGDCVNLMRLCDKHGLRCCYLNPEGVPAEADVCFPDQYQYIIGYPDEIMCAVYNSFDVLLMVSMGEGFGIPLVEAQACGCPVITGDWTSMSELCFGGWKVKKHEAEKTWVEGFASWMYSPHISAVLEKLNAAYEMRNNLEYSERARHGAEYYDADRVVEKYWKPTLEDIERAIKGAETEMELVKF